MNSHSLSTLAIFGFVILGTVCLELRREALSRDEAAREDTFWELTYDAHFDARVSHGQEQSQVRLAVPFDTRHCQVIRGREGSVVTNPNLHSKLTRPYTGTGNRLLVFSTRQAGAAPYDAKAKFVLRLSPRADEGRTALESLPSHDRFLRPEVDLPTTEPAVKQIAKLAPADAQTDFERLQWAFEYCSSIDSNGDAPTDDAKLALTTKHGSPKGRARAMTTLCRALGLPARLVAGFIVRQGAEIRPHVWVEVFQNQQWEPFDPTNGYSLNLPMDYVPVRRDADEVHSAQNVSGLTIGYSIKRLPPDPRIMQAELQDPLQILNLRRLPVKMHTVMKILLLLPFAALITTLLRNVIGLGTFGTFSPALLAMSFIYADWKTGLAILLIVFTVGLLGRWSLERLRLLTVPRLSIILTLVILSVVFGISALHFMTPGISAEVVLLPMVIMTNLIERFHVSADEDGMLNTLKLACGTLFVALLCYLVLGSQPVGNFVLTYPEAHFFTIAVFIVLGRYAGYRLTELWRFRDLIEPAGGDGLMFGINRRRLLAWPIELEKAGVLGINRRNLAFVQASNPRALYPRVDDKTITKEFCHIHDIPVPETYAVIRRYGDVRRFTKLIGDRSEFVVKPASGSAGRGIVVVARRKGKDFETSSGRTIGEGELMYHLSTILSGLYSLGGQVDSAIVEQRIIMHPTMERIAVGGTPDVRVILYKNVPVMAMVRLPTTQSEGRANLHQGAAAAAVHLVSGRTFGGVCNNRAMTHHPDTGEPIAGLEIPGWRELLAAAMKLSDALELGYIGVDFVIDAKLGAVVLEANARPGLAIQVAHGTGLLPRLEFIDSLSPEALVGERRWELLPRLAGVGGDGPKLSEVAA